MTRCGFFCRWSHGRGFPVTENSTSSLNHRKFRYRLVTWSDSFTISLPLHWIVGRRTVTRTRTAMVEYRRCICSRVWSPRVAQSVPFCSARRMARKSYFGIQVSSGSYDHACDVIKRSPPSCNKRRQHYGNRNDRIGSYGHEYGAAPYEGRPSLRRL
jgi:hypothetical protein